MSCFRNGVNKLSENFDKVIDSKIDKNIKEIMEMRNIKSSNYEPSVPQNFRGRNILLYGVPGSGKSYTIKQEYCDDEERMERVVFHPDYTYSDFVGQILPNVTEKMVNYEFKPGPFTRLLKKAYDNPSIEFFLIIEEINRGNAPAIFGDIFQLLDRNDKGESEYSISNTDIAKIVYGDETRKVGLSLYSVM